MRIDVSGVGVAGVLPRGVGWLRRLVPISAGTMSGNVGTLLFSDPEMRRFVAEVPQAGRVLRPFCEAMKLKPPEWLALPKRKRVRKKDTSRRLSEEDEEKLRRITARFPDTPATRSAKRALRRGFEGRPVNLNRMSAVARAYALFHPPRDGNCPPPEIGYGGRAFPPLPKDYEPPKDWD